ncbi:nep-1 [Pristionchus pacificus]|uniref:Nep-1 n=1 Tax=Pristionchus pacificus TaxID=54126 RepID=A0A2A6CXP6_PRIPA|nr:nep-1 [Pristionchus pacificus]|eukprot:PDM82908.1 nep-1 [Pristionchus pacificus]
MQRIGNAHLLSELTSSRVVGPPPLASLQDNARAAALESLPRKAKGHQVYNRMTGPPPLLAAVLLLQLSCCGILAAPADVTASDGFKEASTLLARAVNLTADPCEDFYSYSCGNWIKSHEIPSDRVSISRFVLLRQKVTKEMKEVLESTSDVSKSKSKQKVRQIYRTCLDEEALEKAKSQDMIKAIKAVGSWPMIEGSTAKFNPREFDLTNLLVEVGFRGVSPFLDVYITIDPKNTSRRVLSLDQGGLGLGSSARNYYLNTTKYEKQVTAYKTYIFEKASLITEDYGAALSEMALKADIEEIFNLEQKLAEILLPNEDRRNYTEMHNVRKLSELSTLFPLIDWPRYFKAQAPFDVHPYFDTDPDVIISEIDFLKRLANLLSNTEPRIVANYIMLRYSGSFGLTYDKRYDDVYHKLVKILLGKDDKSERWKDCVAAAQGKMAYASSALYAEKYFDKSAKATTLAMIDEITAAFNEMLKENSWMDETTKKEALEKANNMIRLIGFADWVLDDDKLDEWYEKLDVSASDTLEAMVEKSHRWSNDFSYRRLLEKVDRHEFTTNSATVNAFYSSIKNGIIFPAGILQLPFFSPSFPKALNYGGIGAVIGHEITHGFDDLGNQFDASGNLHEWWQQQTRKEFEKRAKCIIDQYGNETIPEIDMNLNGKLTQGENIADNGGIKAAYRAYSSYLAKHGPEPRLPGMPQITNEQLFFIGYAQTWCNKYKPEALTNTVLTDPHAPGKFRVEVVAKNQKEFAAAFNCPIGSRMNPDERCAVW